jgi:hypothetical protein
MQALPSVTMRQQVKIGFRPRRLLRLSLRKKPKAPASNLPAWRRCNHSYHKNFLDFPAVRSGISSIGAGRHRHK